MSPARRLNDRHPFEIYLLSLACISSIPAALGVAPSPGSITSQLPGVPARFWAVTMAVGALTALVGLTWKRPPWPLLSVTGLLLEQVGLVTCGGACVVYAAAVVLTAGAPALLPAGLTLAFGLACFAQSVKIRKVLRATRTA